MSDNCWKSAQLPGLQQCRALSITPSGTPLLRPARCPGRARAASNASRRGVGGGAALCGLIRPCAAPLRAPRRASASVPHVPACGGQLLLAPPGRSRRCPLAGNGFSRPYPAAPPPASAQLSGCRGGCCVPGGLRCNASEAPLAPHRIRGDRRAPFSCPTGNGGAAWDGRSRLLPAAAAVEPPPPSCPRPPLVAVRAAVPGGRQRSGCLS